MSQPFGYAIERERRAELEATAVEFRPHLDGRFSAPLEIDPRPWHRIEMQGSMGSCQGHALSSVCEMAYHLATGQVTQFSPLFAYYATQKIDGLLGSDQGSTISGGAECAKRFGACPLDVMPYPNPVVYTGVIPAPAWPAAEVFKIQHHVMCRSYDDVFTFLASGQGGVELGIGWNSSMSPNAEGVIDTYDRHGGGGHAICFLGYSRRVDHQGRAYLWLANSWSESWGQHGWAEVAPAAVDAMFDCPNTVMIGLSDLTVPTPRSIDWAAHSVFS